MTSRNEQFPCCKIIANDGSYTIRFDISAFPDEDIAFIIKQLDQYTIRNISRGCFEISTSYHDIALTLSRNINMKYFDRSTQKVKDDMKEKTET